MSPPPPLVGSALAVIHKREALMRAEPVFVLLKHSRSTAEIEVALSPADT
jgi:hypothetical protein